MANLGYGTSRSDAPRRQIAGWGGNDEYAGSSGTPTPPPAPPVVDQPAPAPSQPHGVASLGYGDAVDPTGLGRLSLGLPFAAYEASKKGTPVTEQIKQAASRVWDRVPVYQQGPSANELADKYKADLPVVEEVNLGRKPGVVYDDMPAAPFALKAKAEEVPYPEEGTLSPDTSKAAQPARPASPLDMFFLDKNKGARAEDDSSAAPLAAKQPEQFGPPKPTEAAQPVANPLDGLMSNPAEKTAPAAAPQRLTRDRLLKMSGENVAANDQARAERVGNELRRRELRSEWNDASRQAASGNLSERELGLRRQSELEREGLSRGFLQQETGAQTAYKKFMNNPYNKEQIALIRAEEKLQAEADAAFQAQEQTRKDAEAKAKIEQDKVAFEKEKEGTRKEEKRQEREDSLNDKFQSRMDKLSDIESDFERQKELGKIQQDYSKELANLKFGNMKGVREADSKDMNLREAQNAMKQYGAEGLRTAIEKAQSALGISGRLQFNMNNETVKKEVDDAFRRSEASYNQFVSEQKTRNRVRGISIPDDAYPKWNRDLLKDLYDDRKPKTWDDIKAFLADGEAAYRKTADIVTDILPQTAGLKAAGRAMGNAAQGRPGQPMMAPFLPPQQGFDYTQLLNQ